MDGAIVVAHKDVLTAGSEYFRRCLSGPFLESASHTINLDDVKKELLQQYVGLCYHVELDCSSLNDVRVFRIPIRFLKDQDSLEELMGLGSLCDRFLNKILGKGISRAVSCAALKTALAQPDKDSVESWADKISRWHAAILEAPWLSRPIREAYEIKVLETVFSHPTVWGTLSDKMAKEFLSKAAKFFLLQSQKEKTSNPASPQPAPATTTTEVPNTAPAAGSSSTTVTTTALFSYPVPAARSARRRRRPRKEQRMLNPRP